MSDEANLRRAAEMMRARPPTVVLTGAGMSTESGISDFRSPGGIWSRYRPVTIQEFLESEEARRRYWEYKRVTHEEFAGARPNVAHQALARLEIEGPVAAVVTQNIDGLHQEAGSRTVLELHGTNRRVVCLGCAVSHDREEIQRRLLAGEAVPKCEACGGYLKPATVSFGQSLPEHVLSEAIDRARACGCFLAVGSSLVVYPAAEIPLVAARSGAKLIVINREETPLDATADVVVRGEVSAVLPALAQLVLGGPSRERS